MDWIIEGVVDNPLFQSQLNSTTVTFDKAFDAFSDIPPILGDIGTNVSFDCAIMPTSLVEGMYLYPVPMKDWAMEGISDVCNTTSAEMSPKKTVASRCESEIPSDTAILNANPALDLVYGLNIINDYTSLDIMPNLDCANVGDASSNDIKAELDYLERAILTIPPDGVITILNSSSSMTGESKLDGAKIERGVTTILEARVTGTRLDSYLIEFFVRQTESDAPFITKSSDKAKGGITIQSITPSPDMPGSRQLAIMQIALKPEDTMMIDKSKVCFYDFRFSNRGMGEDYRVSPRKENGDTGTFTIII